MPSVTCHFPIIHSPTEGFGARVEGIGAASADDVHAFAQVAGLPVQSDERIARLDVALDEESPEFASLIALIAERYGLRPRAHRVIRADESSRVFGVMKLRSYTDAELDECEYLYISFVDNVIAAFTEGTPEQIASEIFVAKNRRKKKSVHFGTLMPFHATAVSGQLKSQLEKAHLKGLDFTPVAGVDDLWKISGKLILPRSEIALQDGTGAVVDADSWPTQWSDKYFDDGGYIPAELTYRERLDSLMQGQDVAATYEKVGVNEARAFRYNVVSQRFRRTMTALGVEKIRYTPVRSL